MNALSLTTCVACIAVAVDVDVAARTPITPATTITIFTRFVFAGYGRTAYLKNKNSIDRGLEQGESVKVLLANKQHLTLKEPI